jgi:hypothetical protein
MKRLYFSTDTVNRLRRRKGWTKRELCRRVVFRGGPLKESTFAAAMRGDTSFDLVSCIAYTLDVDPKILLETKEV